jgi:hypothetical protein
MEERGKVRSEMEREKQVTMRGNSGRQEQWQVGGQCITRCPADDCDFPRNPYPAVENPKSGEGPSLGINLF